jgi:hypothetical protein
MSIVPVLVQEWQQSCCGEPFAVGDSVAWTLELREPADVALTAELAREVTVDAEPREGQSGGRVPTLVRADGLVAFWRAPLRIEGQTRVRAVFIEEHHGELPDDIEPARGVVRRVRALWEEYDARVENGTRVFRLMDGESELRDVESSEDDGLDGGGRPPDNWVFEGWVVDLEVGA